MMTMLCRTWIRCKPATGQARCMKAWLALSVSGLTCWRQLRPTFLAMSCHHCVADDTVSSALFLRHEVKGFWKQHSHAPLQNGDELVLLAAAQNAEAR